MSRQTSRDSDERLKKDALHMQRLIASKKLSLEPQDGRIEIATAIAAVSSLVTVDASQHPFQTVPPNLFKLTFNDPSVGISDDQMPVFKADLTHLLPEIAADIMQIQENASLPIEQVAEFVQVSLLAQSGANT